MRQHGNTFDLVRLVAASLVLLSHQHGLMGLPEPTVTVLRTSIGGLGLYIFFAVSGYLNTISVSHHQSLSVFLFNRALRIYPALAVCTVFTVVLGIFVASDLHAFLNHKLLSYIAKNTTLLFGVKTSVPGVFEQSPFPGALNGSLWSLPYEVKMYIVLALGLATARYNLIAPIVLFACASVIAALSAIGILQVLSDGNWYWWVMFSVLFLAGSAVAAAQSFVGLPLAICGLIAVAFVFAGLDQHLLMWQLLLAATIVVIGSSKTPQWLRPPLDISYGVYLYAFPVQQLSTVLFRTFWPALAFSTVLTFTLALLSALLIERRALKAKGFDPIRLISPIPLANMKRLPTTQPKNGTTEALKG
jgi:peptidoglycan/LPS O-acetylase OafA/YrhL